MNKVKISKFIADDLKKAHESREIEKFEDLLPKLNGFKPEDTEYPALFDIDLGMLRMLYYGMIEYEVVG